MPFHCSEVYSLQRAYEIWPSCVRVGEIQIVHHVVSCGVLSPGQVANKPRHDGQTYSHVRSASDDVERIVNSRWYSYEKRPFSYEKSDVGEFALNGN